MWTQGENGQWQQIKVPRFRTAFNFRKYGKKNPGQRAVKNQVFAQSQMARAARQQASFLRKYLKKGMDKSDIPEMEYGRDIQLPELQGQLDDAGEIARTYMPDGDFSADRRRVEEAIMSRYNDQFGQDQEALRAQLASEGLVPGSEAYNERMGRLDRQRTDARMQAILAGGQEQSRLADLARSRAEFQNMAQAQQYAQNLTTTQLENEIEQLRYSNQIGRLDRLNALRLQALEEVYAERNQPLNEINALMSMSQVTTPEFAPLFRQGIEAAPIGQYMQDQYAAELQAHQANQAGMMGLGQAAMQGIFGMMSDKRVKENIRKVGKLKNGLTVYSFNYKGGGPTQIGLMAQDVEKRNPDAVTTVEGIKHVDYEEAAA